MKAVFAALAMSLAASVNAASLLQSLGSIKGFQNPTFTVSQGGKAACVNGNIAVPASALNEKILLAQPADQLALTELFVEFLQVNSNLSTTVNGGRTPVSGTYNINSRLCYPVALSAPTANTVQFLIHGIGFDKSYWDIAPGYSYIDAAAAAGYTTFSYDRLGVGLSDHPDAIEVVQSYLEVEIAHSLIQLLRSGTVGPQAFKTVVGAGHSFGSIQTVGLAAEYPKDLDAIILQGFTVNTGAIGLTFADFNSAIAAQDAPARFPGLSNGYLVTDTSIANSFAFFRYPNFDQTLFYAVDARKQTYTIGEVFTLAGVIAPAPAFTGPVDVVDGENDFIFCQGDCTFPVDQAAVVQPALFPAAAAGSQSFLVPGVGHAVNAHYAAPQAYAQMLAFLKANNINP